MTHEDACIHNPESSHSFHWENDKTCEFVIAADYRRYH